MVAIFSIASQKSFRRMR